MRRELLALTLLLACNSQGGLPGPSGEPGPPGPMGTPGKDSAGAGASPYRSGSRLEVRWMVDRYEDGAQAPAAHGPKFYMFDRELNVACQARQTTDHIVRCLPYSSIEPDGETAVSDSFSDNRCSVRIAHTHSKSKVPRFVATDEILARIYEAGAAIPTPAKVYRSGPECGETLPPENRLFYLVGRELPPTDFVGSQLAITN
jgi:hypothetical protein